MGQLKLNIFKGKRGGRRPGVGRKRIHSPGVAHRARKKVTDRFPIHINFKVNHSIKNKTCLRILKKAISNARSHGLRIIHFSLESNHVHLLIEATDNAILTKGMRSLTITFAKGINKGRIQLERYHLHILKSVRETRNAFHYVVLNHAKHAQLKRAYIDSYSSLGWVRELRKLAMESKLSVIMRRFDEVTFLDKAESWLLKKVLT